MSLPLDNKCFVTSITLCAMRRLGPESLDWEPEALRDSFEEEFGIGHLSQKMFDKLNCGYTLVGTNAFSASIEGFLTATAVMNNVPLDSSTIPYCTLKQCAWSVWEYGELLGDIQDGKLVEEFCPDVAHYVREVARSNGISVFPTWLSFAQPEGSALPDLTGDVTQFEMYQARQEEHIGELNALVTEKQARLTEELLKLQKLGIIG